MRALTRPASASLALLILLAPALWNGFPLLQYDTGGYLARWFEGTLVPSRSTAYGLFLNLLAFPDFWPAVLAQSALTVWIVALTLRVHGFGGRPLVLLAVTALLGVLTTVPWLASILLTDIFAGLAVLALYLLVFADAALQRYERAALLALMAFAVATHSATFAVLLALLSAAVLARGMFRVGAASGLARGTAALALGALLLLAANFAVARRIAWTPGGPALVFGRMLQDGIVARYLAEHCPDPRLKLCAHRHELPDDADVFFWGESVFDRLGRFEGLGEEMQTIVLQSLRAYPAWQVEAALVAAARQLLRVGTGEGVVDSIWHTYATVERFTPSNVPAMRAARQQHGQLGFAAINRLHEPVALASMLALLVIAMAGWRRRPFADLAPLATAVALALLANAAVCGVLANPHDRYGARLAWLAPLVVLLALARMLEGRRPSTAAAPDGGPAGAEPATVLAADQG